MKTRKRFISMLLCIVMVLGMLPMSVFAADVVASGYCGGEGDGTNLTWTLDSEGLLVISGTGDMVSYSSENSYPWSTNKANIKELCLTDGITSIGVKAFSECSSLRHIIFPEDLSVIGYQAFINCISIESISIPASISTGGIGGEAFKNCKNLAEISYYYNSFKHPDAFSNVFSECPSLSKFNILSENEVLWVTSSYPSLAGISGGVKWLFTSSGDLRIAAVSHPEEGYESGGVPDFGTRESDIKSPWSIYSEIYTRIERVEIESGVTRIGSEAFISCYNIESITIPDTVLEIGQYAFQSCNALKTVTIPESATKLGEGIFYNCSSLKSALLPKNCEAISKMMFSGCKGLESILIPNEVKEIGENAFSNCISLKSITLPDEVRTIGYCAFSGCSNIGLVNTTPLSKLELISEGSFSGCTSLQKFSTPNCVEAIGRRAFSGCESLESIDLPRELKYISAYTFEGCEALKEIIVPNSVLNIDTGAFENCVSLAAVDFASDAVVERIGSHAFGSCSSIQKIVFPESIKSISDANNSAYRPAFVDCTNLSDVYFRGNAPQTRTPFPENVTIHYAECASGWTDSDAYDAKAGTWNGYKIEIWDKGTSDNITYTNFGKLENCTYKYTTDPSTGLGKYIAETITIDGVTYTASETSGMQHIVFPEGGYLKEYYYVAYNLDESGVIINADFLPGVECTLEGYDATTKVVDTSLVPIVGNNESDRTLPLGSYYVSEVTAKDFPTDKIGSWVGDTIRVYCVGETIYKAIHVVKGSGTITDYDPTDAKVYIDGLGYDVFPDEELIALIQESILYVKDYILYDDVLVSLASENKYLSIDINNTGKSYFVGDEIVLYISDCTETSDDYLSWTKPEGLVIQVNSGEKISLKRCVEFDDFTECVFVADKPGVVTVSISDSLTSEPVNVTLHITEDKYSSLRADKVPTYEYDAIIDKDFYNTYVNGMYVADFTYKDISNGLYRFDFTVYNETYAPGVVEVYDENGEIQDIKIIGKFSDPSSLKSVIIGGKDMIVDMWNGDSFSFRGVSASKKTKISVDVPQDGYVIVTNSCAISPACLYVNMIDFFLTGAGLVDSTLKLSDAQSDNVKNDIIKAIYSSGTSQKMAADLYAKLYEDLGTALSQNSVSALFGLATDNVDLLMDTFDIDLEKIMMNVGVGTMFSTFQGLIQKGGGPAGDALTAIFYVQKALNYVMQMKQFANNVENRIGWAVFPPVLNNDTTAITSKDGITVESEDGLPSETILQVYKIVDYSHSTNGLDLKENDNYTLYDISLIRNGEETQPKKPVTVYIPIPEGYQQASIMVYRQDQNGEWAFVATMIYNGMIVFEVDHFCLFAIIETSSEAQPIYTITFDANGGRVDTTSDVTDKNGMLTTLPTPLRNGYRFDGWFTQEQGGARITTSTVFVEDTVIYAHWIKHYDPSGNIGSSSSDSTDNSLSGNTGNAPMTSEQTCSFVDVIASDWFYNDVMYAYENGLMTGTAADQFSPAVTTTRGMIVTILWRLEDEAVVSDARNFDDVPNGRWYTKAVNWAAANSIVEGYDDGTFGPDDPLTREQMASILYRYAQYKGYDITVGVTLDNFVDASQVSDWALAAMRWACGEKLIQGDGNKLLPQGSASRSQLAAILHRFCEMIDIEASAF